MDRTKFILGAVFLFFITADTVVSEQRRPVSQCQANGKLEFLSEDNQMGSIEFEVYKQNEGQSAGGFFRLSLEKQDQTTYVDVRYVSIADDFVWFAGNCTKGSGDFTGRWIFIAANDGGRPGKLVDHIWWEWLPDTQNAENIAKRKVENLEKPAYNKPIETGEITVSTNKEKD